MARSLFAVGLSPPLSHRTVLFCSGLPRAGFLFLVDLSHEPKGCDSETSRLHGLATLDDYTEKLVSRDVQAGWDGAFTSSHAISW